MLDIKKYEKLKKDMINKTIIANDKIKLENNFKNSVVVIFFLILFFLKIIEDI